jgi:hypothetical protein
VWRWNEFQAVVRRCVSVPLSERQQCLAGARDAFRAANPDCAALSSRDRKECRKYAKLWEDTELDLPTAAATDDEAPAAVPAAPVDEPSTPPGPDSTTSSRNAAGTVSDETRAE